MAERENTFDVAEPMVMAMEGIVEALGVEDEAVRAGRILTTHRRNYRIAGTFSMDTVKASSGLSQLFGSTRKASAAVECEWEITGEAQDDYSRAALLQALGQPPGTPTPDNGEPGEPGPPTPAPLNREQSAALQIALKALDADRVGAMRCDGTWTAAWLRAYRHIGMRVLRLHNLPMRPTVAELEVFVAAVR